MTGLYITLEMVTSLSDDPAIYCRDQSPRARQGPQSYPRFRLGLKHQMESRIRYQDPDLRLKSTPPRAVRNSLDRERLKLSRFQLGGARVAALLAPPGFGKTSQLIHWRREALAAGGLAFWYTIDDRDDPLRFVRGLACCANATSGKNGFADSLMQWIQSCRDPLEAMTGWLAEVADLSVDVLLLLDEAHLLPAQTRNEMLPYLLGNAPANLRIALAARPVSALTASGAVDTAQVYRVTASELRFRFEETMAVLTAALAGRCNPEAGLRLHDLVEGWPLGVQLAAAALLRSGELEGLLSMATADIRRYFVETLIDRQNADSMHLLVRLGQFDLIHPDLCTTVLGRAELGRELLRLQEETPLFIRAEGNDWTRLHTLAREALSDRAARLPSEERCALALKASAWYAAQGLYEAAAQQALLAGDVEAAIALAERQADRMGVQGRHDIVLAWHQRLSREELDRHPGFWAPTAWAFAMSERRAEADALIDRILTHSDLAPKAKFEATLIRAVAAAFSDRCEVMTNLLAEWPDAPASARLDHLPIYFGLKGYVALHQARPEQSRLELSRIEDLDPAQTYSPVTYGFAAYGAGLTYLWEGRCALAEQELRPALARAEEEINRRSPVACMIAALLAQALWESGNDFPIALLAGRLPVIERLGLPDALISAYKTLARVSDHEGRQDKAVAFLESLRAIGAARKMPRVQVAALFEMVRMHARRGRRDTAREIADQLTSLLSHRPARTPETVIRWGDLHAEMAGAYASLVCNDTAGALQAARSAVRTATGLKRGGDLVEARLLLAEALNRRGSPEAPAVRDEAISLAQAGAMLRIIREQALRSRNASTAPSRSVVHLPAMDAVELRPEAPIVLGSGLLTSKEREVLTLLCRRLSNKEIARALDVGEQTIKWHVKNIFGKLDAGDRKHAVARARMLGLVDTLPPESEGNPPEAGSLN